MAKLSISDRSANPGLTGQVQNTLRTTPLITMVLPKVRQATGVRPLPVDDRTVVRVVRFLIAPVVTDLVSQSIFVQLDAEVGVGRQFDIPIHHLERIPDVTRVLDHMPLVLAMRYPCCILEV